MGTNYYLEPVDATCPTCEADNSRQLHIGKSSLGWVFTWHGYRGEGRPVGRDLTTPTEWFTYLAEETGARKVIRDEYGVSLTPADLMRLVLAKRKPRENGDAPARHETPHSFGFEAVHVEGDDVLFAEFS
jgi:hypothetical protein